MVGAIGYPFEGVDVGGLVSAGETFLVVLAVRLDVLLVPQAKLVDGLLDHFESAFLPHRLGAVGDRLPTRQLTPSIWFRKKCAAAGW